MRHIHVRCGIIVLLGMDPTRYKHVEKPLRRRVCYRVESTGASQWRERVKYRSRTDGTSAMNAEKSVVWAASLWKERVYYRSAHGGNSVLKAARNVRFKQDLEGVLAGWKPTSVDTTV
jgi:hypothetical protein